MDGRKREHKEREFCLFLFFVSLLDLRKSDRRFSSEQKAKLVYATRATRGYQKLNVYQTLRGREFSYLCYL